MTVCSEAEGNKQLVICNLFRDSVDTEELKS